jgi:hypothetical protein
MSWHQRLLLVYPDRVQARLDALERLGVQPVPNLWQVELGVLRMWHRTFFRSDTIGTCAEHPVRPTLRARLMARRPLRFPFLVKEKAIAPWDMSGLAQEADRLIGHLLTAHHDATQFVYDLQILTAHPGALQRLRRRLDGLLDGTDPKAEWFRDLCVFEHYHEALSEGLDRVLAGEVELDPSDADDPDISFYAYLRWCAAQPEDPASTWAALRAGRYHPQHGLTPAADRLASEAA